MRRRRTIRNARKCRLNLLYNRLRLRRLHSFGMALFSAQFSYHFSMGKRKGRKKPPPKLNRAESKLPSSFDCPFCSSPGTVSCKMCNIYFFSLPNSFFLVILSVRKRPPAPHCPLSPSSRLFRFPFPHFSKAMNELESIYKFNCYYFSEMLQGPQEWHWEGEMQRLRR